MTMRVAWNLLWLRPGMVGGSEEYATRQLRALVDHAPDVRLTAFVLRPFVDAYPDLAREVTCVVAPFDGQNKALRVGLESTWLAAQTHRGFDVVHHLGGRIPQLAARPRVVTVHDLQPLELPHNFGRVKRLFLARALPRSVARASLIVTPSEQVRDRVITRFAVDPARVRAIAAPIPMVEHHSSPVDVGSAPPSIRGLLRGEHPFFVYPAFTYPHKNHLVLLDAFARVRTEHPDAQLVLLPGAGGNEHEVRARLARDDLARAVVRIERVERRVLDALLARAAALTFPSKFEGFGLPVIEALAAGCPVIASDIDVLREVVRDAADDAAVLVDPDDVGAWANALSAVLADPQRRQRSELHATRAVTRYTPESSARALSDVYRTAVGS